MSCPTKIGLDTMLYNIFYYELNFVLWKTFIYQYLQRNALQEEAAERTHVPARRCSLPQQYARNTTRPSVERQSGTVAAPTDLPAARVAWSRQRNHSCRSTGKRWRRSRWWAAATPLLARRLCVQSCSLSGVDEQGKGADKERATMLTCLLLLWWWQVICRFIT